MKGLLAIIPKKNLSKARARIFFLLLIVSASLLSCSFHLVLVLVLASFLSFIPLTSPLDPSDPVQSTTSPKTGPYKSFSPWTRIQQWTIVSRGRGRGRGKEGEGEEREEREGGGLDGAKAKGQGKKGAETTLFFFFSPFTQEQPSPSSRTMISKEATRKTQGPRTTSKRKRERRPMMMRASRRSSEIGHCSEIAEL
jgi:hypothetical protein